MKDLTSVLDKYRISFHILFWAIYVLTVGVIYGNYGAGYIRQISLVSFYTPVTIFASYILMYYQLPHLLFKQKYFRFILSVLFFVALSGLLQRLINYYLVYPHYFPERIIQEPVDLAYILMNALKIYYVAAAAVAIKFMKQWYKSQQATQSLQKQKLEAELKFLKSQIHPHFLFNTLNNLYALTLKKSDKAPETVLKLSDLLNYMLYECNARKVSLDKEINLLNNYISLERIRYDESLKVDVKITGSSTGKQIAPMLLLPLVENSFKHGLSKECGNPWLNIHIDIQKDKIDVLVDNSKHEQDNMKDETGYTEGIGLTNVNRRLELIYPDKHSIKIENNKNNFSVFLSIDLDINPALKAV